MNDVNAQTDIPRPWLNTYDDGVPETIDVNEYESLVELIETACVKHADRVAFSNMGSSITYAELDSQSRAFAAWLQQDINLKKGDRVAIMMPNIMQYPVALAGILRAGGTVVNVNPLYTPTELKHQLKDSGARAIIILENFAHTLESVLEDKTDPISLDAIVVTRIGDSFPWLKSLLITSVVRYLKKGVPAWNIPQSLAWNAILKKGAQATFSPVDVKPDDLAFLQYTGGTTGVSKGAMLTHRNMVANILQTLAWTDVCHPDSPVIVTPLPLYHIFSLTLNCLMYMKLGGNNVLITNPRDLPAFIKTLQNTHIDAITGVNTLYNALLDADGLDKVDFSHAKLVAGGGMAVQSEVAKRWQEVTGTIIREGYGLTETSPVLCINPMLLDEFTGAVGLPVSNTDIAILDDDGNILSIGETGEICARGPQIMPGYWQRPEETAQTFHNEWFKTGDIGYIDERGFVYIADRKKDMILVSGFNVYPNEVEAALAKHPEIVESAVIGVPDDESGEAVKAFIVCRGDELDKADVIAHCRESLTGYKVPKQIEFKQELPKTNVGKVLRRALRD